MTQVQSHNSFPIALSFLEVASSICSIVVVTWGIVPLIPGAMWLRLIPFLLIFIQSSTSQILRGETLEEIGLTAHHLAVASKLLIPPTLISTGLLLLIGVIYGQVPQGIGFLIDLPALLLSGMVQQYLLQGFIHRRIDFAIHNILKNDSLFRSTLPIFLTALTFSLVHLPNVVLTALTFLAGLIWAAVYKRAPSIYALGVSHGLMSLVAINTLPPRLLHSLSVGYKHFLYQSYP